MERYKHLTSHVEDPLDELTKLRQTLTARKLGLKPSPYGEVVVQV